MVNRKSSSPTPEPILQLQRQLEEFRGSQPGRVKCELSVAVRKLQAVALGNPVMPVADGFFG